MVVTYFRVLCRRGGVLISFQNFSQPLDLIRTYPFIMFSKLKCQMSAVRMDVCSFVFAKSSLLPNF